VAADTRQRIVESALTLFGRKGYAATSVAEIEQAAGLKPGAGGLYAHFPSKAELLAAAIERSVALVEAGYAMHAALPLGDLRAELTLIARGSFVLFDAMEDWMRMALKDGDRFRELFASSRDGLSSRAYRYLADVLSAKVKSGELAEHDTDAVADVLFGAISNYWLQTRIFEWRPNDVSQDDFIAAWVDLALRLARPRRAS
jgi:AcrR family transcriptional regulator